MYFVLGTLVLVMTSCEPKGLTENDVFAPTDEAALAEMLKAENPDGQYKIYNINSLLAEPFMTEAGNFKSDSSLYRTRSSYKGLELFSIDTLPTNGPGIYIRGRVATDDYGGNFYKSLVIQQINDWGVREVIITLGGGGSVIYAEGQFYETPAYPPTKLVDATGCGDTYSAGYLYARAKGMSYFESGQFAAAMCTLKLEHTGPFAHSIDDVHQIIKNNQ